MTIFSTCARCDDAKVPVEYDESLDEWICASCAENLAEAAYERQQAADLESPPESAREEQLRTWKEHQEAHKR